MTIRSLPKRTIILLIFFLGLLFALIYFGLRPETVALMAKRDELAAKKSANETLAAKMNALLKAKNNSEEIASAFETVNILWPENEEVSKFIVQTEGLAAEKNIVLSTVSITPASAAAESESKPQKAKTKTAGNSEEIKFTFNGSGSYSDILNFIIGLEKLARFNQETNVTLNSADSETIAFVISGSIYAK